MRNAPYLSSTYLCIACGVAVQNQKSIVERLLESSGLYSGLLMVTKLLHNFTTGYPHKQTGTVHSHQQRIQELFTQLPQGLYKQLLNI